MDEKEPEVITEPVADVVEPEPAQPSQTGLPTPSDVDLQRGYRVTKWHEHDNFECLKCQYATLWREKIEKHLAIGQHEWAYPTTETGRLSDAPKNTGGPEY